MSYIFFVAFLSILQASISSDTKCSLPENTKNFLETKLDDNSKRFYFKCKDNFYYQDDTKRFYVQNYIDCSKQEEINKVNCRRACEYSYLQLIDESLSNVNITLSIINNCFINYKVSSKELFAMKNQKCNITFEHYTINSSKENFELECIGNDEKIFNVNNITISPLYCMVDDVEFDPEAKRNLVRNSGKFHNETTLEIDENYELEENILKCTKNGVYPKKIKIYKVCKIQDIKFTPENRTSTIEGYNENIKILKTFKLKTINDKFVLQNETVNCTDDGIYPAEIKILKICAQPDFDKDNVHYDTNSINSDGMIKNEITYTANDGYEIIYKGKAKNSITINCEDKSVTKIGVNVKDKNCLMEIPINANGQFDTKCYDKKTKIMNAPCTFKCFSKLALDNGVSFKKYICGETIQKCKKTSKLLYWHIILVIIFVLIIVGSIIFIVFLKMNKNQTDILASRQSKKLELL